MEIITIFAPNLYAVQYNGEEYDELERLFDLWTDPEYLSNFFNEHKENLEYFKVNVEEAIIKTLEEAEELEDMIVNKISPTFIPLNDTDFGLYELTKHKAKISWLRIYAIHIEDNVFLITGGAIKLTRAMQDNPITNKELTKLTQCRDFLKENNVFDSASFYQLLTEK